MSTTSPRMSQIVDWSAAIWAGVIAGAVFFLLNLLLVPLFVGGNIWIIVRLFASVIMGSGILAPPATFDLVALIAALVSNFVLAILFSLLVAYIIHRGGLIAGIVGGALIGLALYLINFYTLTLIYPWFFVIDSWIMVVNHLIFGALAGGIYEALEVEEFVPVYED